MEIRPKSPCGDPQGDLKNHHKIKTEQLQTAGQALTKRTPEAAIGIAGKRGFRSPAPSHTVIKSHPTQLRCFLGFETVVLPAYPASVPGNGRQCNAPGQPQR